MRRLCSETWSQCAEAQRKCFRFILSPDLLETNRRDGGNTCLSRRRVDMRAAFAARKSSPRNIVRVRYYVPCQKRHYTASPSAQSTVQDYDIVVVGGGPAGLAFANALGMFSIIRIFVKITDCLCSVPPARSRVTTYRFN